MNTLWVLMANRSFAKIFEVKGLGRNFKEVYHIENPIGRKKPSEIMSDKPGRTFDRFGAGRHALGTEIDPVEHELKVFVLQISKLLDENRLNKSFDKIAFVAPAHFLGELNRILSTGLKKCLIKEVSKDLPEYLSEQDRIELICKYLDLWNRTPLTS